MPTSKKPKSISIRAYQVGFGDCFLMNLDYGAEKRHVLIDFGTTALPPGADSKTHMLEVANDIARQVGKSPLVVVATHRHADHISGFATKAGKGSGDVIAALKPKLVIQPWTEQPDLAKDATSLKVRAAGKSLAALHALSLRNMQAFAAAAVEASRNMRDGPLKEQLAFIGEDNIANRSAVDNLIAMGKKGKALYVNLGTSMKRLESLLPGVKVHALGPPTIKQSEGVLKMRRTDENEYWHLQLSAAAANGTATADNASPLFPRAGIFARRDIPTDAWWLISHAKKLRGDQTLQIVRILDKAMNNTSLILLFEIGGRRFLFPGDAQIENWSVALADKKYQKLLSEVDVYKVGHHGSLNATPKTLWNMFNKRRSRSKGKAMTSIMSTMAGKHGHEKDKTEVPRRSLRDQLKKETELVTTQSLGAKVTCHVVTVPLT